MNKHCRSPRHPLFKNRAPERRGAAHWVAERLTALALIPLVLYVVARFLCVVTHGDGGADEMFFGAWDAAAGVLLFGIGFYHSAMGMQMIIEDYVRCPVAHFVLLNTVRFVNLALGAAVFVAICLIVARHLGGGSVFA
ncbi:MAG: succinate dehydrogenase, hydrophobic membrane anchor protein [Rickettsiales bacterium]